MSCEIADNIVFNIVNSPYTTVRDTDLPFFPYLTDYWRIFVHYNQTCRLKGTLINKIEGGRGDTHTHTLPPSLVSAKFFSTRSFRFRLKKLKPNPRVHFFTLLGCIHRPTAICSDPFARTLPVGLHTKRATCRQRTVDVWSHSPRPRAERYGRKRGAHG